MAKLESVERKLKNGETIIIRSAEPEDAPALTAYVLKTFQNSQFVVTQADEFHNDLKKEEEWITAIKAGDNRILLIALLNGEIVGNIDFNSNDSRRRIRHRGEFGMSTAEKFRGLGVGRLLLQELIDWAKDISSPIEKIELGVLAGNRSAIHLYEKIGFTEEGRVKKAIKTGAQSYIDEIRMGLFIKN